MPKLCSLCLTYGDPRKEPGASLTITDVLETDEDLVEHIEMVHCIPVRRAGETDAQAKARVQAKNPDYGTSRCPCPGCVHRRRLLEQYQHGDD